MNSAAAGSVLVARYHLVAPESGDLADIGAWSARDEVLDRQVRIAILGGAHTLDALDSARRAALVSDRRLARVLDVGTDGDLAFVVTEPFTGTTLTDVVAAGALNPADARVIVGEAAQALDVARRRGVHHLALRPEAIRIDSGHVIVTGLGVDACILGQDQPEGTRASAQDAEALVALLYYALTARWPGSPIGAGALNPNYAHPLPAAQDAAGVLPLDAVRRDVPADLVALCADTYSAHGEPDAAPRTPADVSARLEPWSSTGVHLPVPARPGAAGEPPRPAGPVGAAVAAAPAGPVAADPAVPVRQSVRAAFGIPSSPAPPGTPPPAPPVRPGQNGWGQRVGVPGVGGGGTAPVWSTPPDGAPGGALAAVGAAPYAAAMSPAVPSAQARATSAPRAGTSADLLTAGPAEPVAAPPGPAGAGRGGPRFNPTALVLVLVGLAVIVAIVWAVNMLGRGIEPRTGAEPTDGTTQQQSVSPGTDPTGGTTTTQSPPTVPPVIKSGQSIDPEGRAQGEYPERAADAYDGDDATYWRTHWYKTPNFGGLKKGVGYVITLEQRAAVSTIALATDNKGGNVQIRATTAQNPTGGTLLAEGPLDGSTTFTFKPTEGQTFVLWFTELPTAPDGKYRVDLEEILLS